MLNDYTIRDKDCPLYEILSNVHLVSDGLTDAVTEINNAGYIRHEIKISIDWEGDKQSITVITATHFQYIAYWMSKQEEQNKDVKKFFEAVISDFYDQFEAIKILDWDGRMLGALQD